MIKLSSGKITFDLAVFGDIAYNIQPRVVIDKGQAEISVVAVKEGDSYVARIPHGMLLEGIEYPARIEVIVEGRILTPLRDNVMFESFSPAQEIRDAIKSDASGKYTLPRGQLKSIIADVLKESQVKVD